VFLSLGIIINSAVDAAEGELAEAVGYQQSKYKRRPVGAWKMLCV